MGDRENSIANADLKKMVEAYKERPRESVKGRLAERKRKLSRRSPPKRRRVKVNLRRRSCRNYEEIFSDTGRPAVAVQGLFQKGLGRSAESHYPTMNIEDIKALPVADIAEKDCALFLWVTFPCLLEGFEVIRAWGFTYKTVAFVWVKQNKKSDSLFWGMGYWTRSNVELCILATKGSPKRVDAGVHQVVVSHIEEHSRKPGEVHERIRRLMGDVPKIELFARRKAEGFDVWGNEVDSDIEFKGGNRLCS